MARAARSVWSFPTCRAVRPAGGTVEEALRNAAEAAPLWRDDARADGEAIPEPRAVEDLRRDPEIAAALASGAVLGFVPTRELVT